MAKCCRPVLTRPRRRVWRKPRGRGLREGALNAAALRIQALALHRALARPGGSQGLVFGGLVFGPRHHRQDPAWHFERDRVQRAREGQGRQLAARNRP